MEYKEFDKMYNDREDGEIIACSIINEDGDVLCFDYVDIINDWYSDNDVEYKWEENKFLGVYYEGKRVVTTNLSPVMFNYIHNDWLLKGK